uniref:Taste receptor type 2 n=1 Tax=Leptobrachium leishanense TaxID=445787 RepID=A0A8C5QCS8_9ANUR
MVTCVHANHETLQQVMQILRKCKIVCGIVCNLFIVAVIGRTWYVEGSLRSIKLILFALGSFNILALLGLTNLLLQTILSWSCTMFGFKSYVTSIEIFYMIHIVLLIFLIASNFWLTLWLSSFYCLKIVNFKKGIFFTLKLRFSEFLPKLLLFSFADCLWFSVLIVCTVSVNISNASSQNTSSADLSMTSHTLVTVNPSYFVFVLIKSIILLIITLIPIKLTVTSLVKHVKKMKNNDFATPQMEAHITATRTIVQLVLLYALFYVSCICILFKSFVIDNVLVFWFYVVTYPGAQAIVIIFGNSKLKKAAKCVQERVGSINTLKSNHLHNNTQISHLGVPL